MKNLLFLSVLALIGFASCGGEKTPEEKIAELEDGIRNNPEMLAAIKAKAEAAKMPLDQQIHNDAVWLYEEANKLPHLGEAAALSGKIPSKEEIIAMKEKEIRENAGMMADVKQKAEAFKVPLDTQIRHDAIWLYESTMKPVEPAADAKAAPAPDATKAAPDAKSAPEAAKPAGK
jgi:uncharacterized protein (DUF427 family)